jgi:putative MATE family efflux protein
MTQMTKVKTKYTLFTNKALFFLIVPIVIEAALTMSLGLVDSFMVKGIGEYGTAMSAVTNVDQISNVMVQLFAAFGTGGAIITSQYLGSNNTEDANKSAKQLYVLMFLASIVVMVFCLILNHQIIDLIYSSNDPVYKNYAYTYFYLMAASYPLLAVFYASAAILRAQRKSMNTMTSAAISFVLNIALNAVFIYWCDWGIFGAAFATFISRIFPATFLSVLVANKNNLVKIKFFEKFRFDGKMIKKILILAIPSGIESCLFQVGKLMTASFVANSFYEMTINGAIINENNVATSISMNINTIGSVVGNGVNTSILTVVGQAVGTGDEKQVKYYIKKMLAISYVGNAICVAIVWGLSPFLIGIFGSGKGGITEQTATIAQNCLHLCFSFQMFTYPLSFGAPAVLKSTSDVRYTMVCAILSMVLMRVGLSYIMTTQYLRYQLGAMGLWIGMVSDWTLRSILFTARIISGKWKKASGLLAVKAVQTAGGDQAVVTEQVVITEGAEQGVVAEEVTAEQTEQVTGEEHDNITEQDK